MARDLTDDIPLNVGNPGTSGFWTNSAEDYDVAIGGVPFILAISDGLASNKNLYVRQTAPYKKDQFDSSTEPGEQSLTGWWIRSQSSFHKGAGIRFYDPSSGETSTHRYVDSQGVDTFTAGQVTLLNSVVENHDSVTALGTDGRARQHVRSIKYGTTDAVLLHDGLDVDKVYPPITYSITSKILTTNVATLTISVNPHIFTVGMTVVVSGIDATFNGTFTITAITATTFSYAKTATNVPSTLVTPFGTATSTVTHFIDYSTEPVYAICDDGTYAYWVTNVAGTFSMYKKLLTSTSLDADTLMFTTASTLIVGAQMEYVKDRIILNVKTATTNSIYELAPNATSLGTAIYSNPNTNYIYTNIAASGAAIYTAGYSGIISTIQKYTLSTTATISALSAASVAAEFPPGEIVHRIYYYLGYMAIGTNKGVRLAVVNDQDGSLGYGPLVVETTQPCYDFAARDRFLYCATGIGALDAGVIKIDLSDEITSNSLRFPYASDLQYTQTEVHYTTGCAFFGSTSVMAFCTARNSTAATNGHVYREDTTSKVASGYVTTGAIRFGTLEPKNYKFVRARGDFSKGSMDIQSIAASGDSYNIITYNSSVGSPEAATTQPEGSQEFISFKFTLVKDTTTATSGPILKGYQIKALPATKRQRSIEIPVWCYDVESDRYNVQIGYEGRAWERIQTLENIEALGDIVNYQDFTTGERVQVLIETINFERRTPPDRNYDGFGGILTLTLRTVL